MAELTLLYTRTSPYARKVRIFAAEKGLALTLEETDPLGDPANLHSANPLGKIPALITATHGALYDSRVICDFLDCQAEPCLIPRDGADRWRVLRLEALADGVMDAAVAMRIERMRDDALRWDVWFERYERAILRALDHLDEQAAALAGEVHSGAIALGAALGYLDFRWPELNWRNERTALAEFYEAISARPSFIETRHPDL